MCKHVSGCQQLGEGVGGKAISTNRMVVWESNGRVDGGFCT